MTWPFYQLSMTLHDRSTNLAWPLYFTLVKMSSSAWHHLAPVGLQPWLDILICQQKLLKAAKWFFLTIIEPNPVWGKKNLLSKKPDCEGRLKRKSATQEELSVLGKFCYAICPSETQSTALISTSKPIINWIQYVHFGGNVWPRNNFPPLRGMAY